MTALPELDEDGYLCDLGDWSEAVAHELAAVEGIALEASHWAVLRVCRAFHRRYEIAPDNRALVKAVRAELGPEAGRSIHLMRLFGGSPARSVARIAGLPKPPNCL